MEIADKGAFTPPLFPVLQAGARKLLGGLLLAMVILNVANAGGRYLVGRAIEGSDELLVFGMAWLVFLGMPLVALQGQHLRLALVERMLAARARLFYASLLDFGIAFLCAWAALQSAAFVERVALIGQTSMAARIPMVIPHTALLTGLVLTALACSVRALFQLIRCARWQEQNANSRGGSP